MFEYMVLYMAFVFSVYMAIVILRDFLDVIGKFILETWDKNLAKHSFKTNLKRYIDNENIHVSYYYRGL